MAAALALLERDAPRDASQRRPARSPNLSPLRRAMTSDTHVAMPNESASSDLCMTCQGEGVTPSEQGPLTCLDCAGLGRLPSGLVRTEWRLRELERIYHDEGGERGQDLRWLIAELRRSHQALLKILAAGQDLEHRNGGDKASLDRIKHLANDVLGVYPKLDASH